MSCRTYTIDQQVLSNQHLFAHFLGLKAGSTMLSAPAALHTRPIQLCVASCSALTRSSNCTMAWSLLSFSPACITARSIRTRARSLIYRWSAAFAGAGMISKLRSCSPSSSESTSTTEESFQGTEAVENDTSKPLYVRSTEAGTLNIRCMDSKKKDTS